ncbi:MAG: hypothetical protein HFF52_06300 [Lawsonibacter sp.]|nr:hypothetical protein [Lawsonibacter sp.]
MRIWNGTDSEAEKIFTELFQQEYEKLIRCAIIYLKAGDTKMATKGRAEVAVQETFALAWEHRDKVLSREKPVGWLYKALQYKSKDILREENKWRKRILLFERTETPSDDPYSRLDLDLYGTIPEQDFDLLHKVYWEGYSYRELCGDMNLSKSALGARLLRLRRKICKELKK